MEVVKAKVPEDKKFSMVFGPYDLKFYYTNDDYVFVGRGSSEMMRKMRYYHSENIKGELASVGQFCEAADATILLGGEHANGSIFNATMAEFPGHKELLKQKGVDYFINRSRGAIRIGNNVVISHSAVILSGVTIGDGALIAAGAVVNKDIPPYAIAAGNPARVVKYRFPEADIQKLLALTWWDWEFSFLMSQIPHMQTGSVDALLSTLPAERPRKPHAHVMCFAFHAETSRMNFVGVEMDGKRILSRELPKTFLDYVNQVTSSEPIVCIPDVFAYTGLKLAV